MASTSTARPAPRLRPPPPNCREPTGGKVLLPRSPKGSESPRARRQGRARKRTSAVGLRLGGWLSRRRGACGRSALPPWSMPPLEYAVRSPEHLTEHLDVLIIGAGLSGIGAACHLLQKCPQKRLAILEARESIGGTWDLFRYPG